MNSKECLEWLKDNYIYLIEEYYNKTLEMKQCVIDMANPKFYIIKEDLDRLEKLEQALDKACERLDYTCIPVEEELVEDLDCDNNCKECWKKYFMKEVLKDD